jgi:thymidylate synthase
MSSINNLDKKYQDLISDILNNGIEKKDRTGTGTLSVFGRQFRHNMSDGFPLLTTKKMAIKSIITELKWFLKGDTNIKYLLENDCHIWTGDAKKWYDESFKKYWGEIEGRESKFKPISTKEFEKRILEDDEFAKKWGDLGPIYGKQWRKWKGKLVDKSKEFNAHTAWVPEQIDQIQNLINNLKTNPDSRRLMVNAWNVGELDQMTLPPCHYGFQVYTRELSLDERFDYYTKNSKHTISHHRLSEHVLKNTPTRAISLMWNQRSVDTFLGLPFNIASYGLLLMMLADEVGMIPDQLIGNLGDVHLYSNHIEQAKEQLTREPMKLPTVHVRDGIFCSSINDVILENYESHSTIKAPLSN